MKRRERRAARVPAGRVTALTDAAGCGFEHLVGTVEAGSLALGRRPRALCGALVLPAALASPNGPRCPDCVVLSRSCVGGARPGSWTGEDRC